LAEENRHLQEMEDHLTALGEDLKEHLPGFTAYEEKLFGNLLTGLERIAA
jgi:hypothetical protein